MRRKILVLVCVCVIALMLASSVPVGAKGKPPKDPPPDDGGTSPTGTIYYYQYDDVDGGSRWTMDGDGGNKAELSTTFNTASTLNKHKDGHYWHVYFKELTTTHHDGNYQTELRAVRDDGSGDCLLWYDSSMVWIGNLNNGICWMSGDAHISWVTWKVATDGSISDQGVYKAAVSWGTDDNTPSLSTPLRVYAMGTFYDDYLDIYMADGTYVNWSSNGDYLLYAKVNDGKVLVDFTTTPPTTTAYAYNGNHAISPDSTKMFINAGGDTLIVMDIDGSNQETILSVGSKRKSNINLGWMYWSPDSNYIVFTQYVFSSQTLSYAGDIYTIGADGSDKAKLTKKTSTCDWYLPLGWR